MRMRYQDNRKHLCVEDERFDDINITNRILRRKFGNSLTGERDGIIVNIDSLILQIKRSLTRTTLRGFFITHSLRLNSENTKPNSCPVIFSVSQEIISSHSLIM